MKKRIKNKAVRKVLRTIANWDNCPTDYKRNWSADLLKYAMCIAMGFITITVFCFFVILCG